MHNFTASGFPSPADFSGTVDYAKPKLDLNAHLIARPAATFFMRSATSELKEYGIFHNDILIVDRAESITQNAIIIAVVEGEMVISPYHRLANREAHIWGRVTTTIHKL